MPGKSEVDTSETKSADTETGPNHGEERQSCARVYNATGGKATFTAKGADSAEAEV